MKCIALSISFAFLGVSAAAQPNLAWVDQFGGDHIEWFRAVASDHAGGVYAAGNTFSGPFAQGGDCLVIRDDHDGNRLWTVPFGTEATDSAQSLAPDGDGGVFVGGYFDAHFNSDKAFLARYDAHGNQLWVTAAGGATEVPALCADGQGGVFVAALRDGTIYFAHYDADGGNTGFTHIGSDKYDGAHGLATDGAGGVFAAGGTFGNLGGPNAGGEDPFLARLDGQGNMLWVRQFGSSETDIATGVMSDGAGGAFVTGYTDGLLGDTKYGNVDSFLAHYDSEGNRLWLIQFGVKNTVAAMAMAPSGPGIAVMGWSTAEFGGPKFGEADVFLANFDMDGTLTWVTQFGSSGDERSYALASDEAGNFFVGGMTSGAWGGPFGGTFDQFVVALGAACAPDLDEDGLLSLFDFLAFVNLFNAQALKADWNTDGVFDLFDFLGYVNAFNGGC